MRTSFGKKTWRLSAEACSPSKKKDNLFYSFVFPIPHDKYRATKHKATRDSAATTKEIKTVVKQLHIAYSRFHSPLNDLTIRPAECQYCQKRFFSGCDYARQHERQFCRLNPDREKKRFPCSFCGKEFNRRTSARIHERNICDQNPERKQGQYQCRYCFASFNQHANARTHERTKCPENPNRRKERFQCQHCAIWFNCRNVCLEHERYLCLVNPKPDVLVCPVCHDPCKGPRALQAHVKLLHDPL